MKIKDLPKVERPREKLAKYGTAKLANSELLAILLRTGVRGTNVVELSNKILKKFSGARLAEASVRDLMATAGLGAAKASEIVACFELGRRFLQNTKSSLLLSPRDVWEDMKDIRESKKEHFVVFFLDSKNQKIKREIVSVGTLSASLVHPREVFEPAITHLAAQVLLAHNHPTEEVEPSKDDEATTKLLIKAGKLLGISVLDHIIVSKEKYFSFASQYPALFR